jgi:ABC-type multidrug transport system fused ATPase/permease subunit
VDYPFKTELITVRYSRIERIWVLFSGLLYTTLTLVAIIGVIVYIESLPQLISMPAVLSASLALLLLYPLKLSTSYFVRGIRGYSYVASMVMEKRTEDVDQWLEAEQEKQQINRGAINASSGNLAKLFTLWGSISRIVIIWLLAIMVCKWLPLEDLINKPILEFSLKDVGAIIAAMNVLAITIFWIGLIDGKTQEEREGIYNGWGLAGIVVITLVLMLSAGRS